MARTWKINAKQGDNVMSILKTGILAAAAFAVMFFSGPTYAASNSRDYTYEKSGSSAGSYYRDPTTREALDSGTW